MVDTWWVVGGWVGDVTLGSVVGVGWSAPRSLCYRARGGRRAGGGAPGRAWTPATTAARWAAFHPRASLLSSLLIVRILLLGLQGREEQAGRTAA